MYVFERDVNGFWSQTAYVKGSGLAPGDEFGSSLALDGDTLIVGAEGKFVGVTYVFQRDAGGAWGQQGEYFEPLVRDFPEGFGSDVALRGDTVLVGWPGEGSSAIGVDGDQSNNDADRSGAVFIFE